MVGQLSYKEFEVVRFYYRLRGPKPKSAALGCEPSINGGGTRRFTQEESSKGSSAVLKTAAERHGDIVIPFLRPKESWQNGNARVY